MASESTNPSLWDLDQAKLVRKLEIKKKSSFQAFAYKKKVVSQGFFYKKKKNFMLTHDLGQVDPRLSFLTMGHCCPYLIIKKQNINPTGFSLWSKTPCIMDC
jgi:hypothetical protein